MDSAQRQEEPRLLTCYSQEIRLQGLNAPSTYANLKTLYRNYLSASLTTNDLETLNSNYLRAAEHLAAPDLSPENYSLVSIIRDTVVRCKKMLVDDTYLKTRGITTVLDCQYEQASKLVRDAIERNELDREYDIAWNDIMNCPEYSDAKKRNSHR